MCTNKPRSRQRNGDRAQAGHHSGSPDVARKRRHKRGGQKKRACRAGCRRNTTKAQRLSRKYFRICSWNCASAAQRGTAVIERIAYDFDILCLQETRTQPAKEIELDDFLVIQRHEGRGTAMIISKRLQSKVSKVDVEQWCNDACELQAVRIEKPDGRHKSVIVINAYIHPGTLNKKEKWEFLEEIEDTYGNCTVICGDLNARSAMWDNQGTNPQGTALEEALGDVNFAPVTTVEPTHPAKRQGDTDSTIDMALVSSRLTSVIHAEALTSHGSDHKPVAFSMRRPGKEQTTRPPNPFKYATSGTVVNRIRARKPKTTKKPSQRRVQPPWWNEEVQQAWNEKRAAVKQWQKDRKRPNPDPSLEDEMKERTKTFKTLADEARQTKWKKYCEDLSRDTTLTEFWQFYQEMEGKSKETIPSDMIDTNGGLLKTNQEKGAALFERFIHQSDQSNLQEREQMLATLNTSHIQDDEITEEDFEAALRCSSKDTAPGPDGVRYSDIRNLSEEDKKELFDLYKESFSDGKVPDDWTHSFLKALPKPGKDHKKLNGYRILTMQNTIGKLLERIIARKLSHDLEDRGVLPPNQGGFRPGKSTWENAAAFAYDVYEGFQKKEQTIAVAIDLEDAYNRVQFSTLIELLQQNGVSATMTRWIAAALQTRTVVMRMGNWSSPTRNLTMGLPQGSPLSPVLFNVYTKGLADLNANGHAKVLTLADDGLIYKTAKEIKDATTGVQSQLREASQWCTKTGSFINPDKAQMLLCTLDNKAAGQPVAPVTFGGTDIERTDQLRYLGVHFDRMLTFNKHVEATALKCKKGLGALKAMAAKGIEQRHLFLLYQSVVLSRIDYGLGLTTMSQTNLQKLERIQNEAMRTILGTTKDTPIDAMRYILDLPPIQTRQKVEQVKAYINAAENPQNPLHSAVNDEKGSRLARGKSWMGQAEESIEKVCPLRDLKQQKEWEAYPKNLEDLHQVALHPNLGRHCREWPAGKTEAEIRQLIEENSKPHDLVIYTDGAVEEKANKSGWGYTVKQNGSTIQEDKGAYNITTSSLTMEVEAVSNALRWLATRNEVRDTHAIILTDSMNLLQKIQTGYSNPEWQSSMTQSHLRSLLWVYCPGHAGVKGNERADKLAGRAKVTGSMKLGRSEVLRGLRRQLKTIAEAEVHHTVDRLQERGVQRGSGRKSELKGRERGIVNQTNIGTVSRATVRRLLRDGTERIWAFPRAMTSS